MSSNIASRTRLDREAYRARREQRRRSVLTCRGLEKGSAGIIWKEAFLPVANDSGTKRPGHVPLRRAALHDELAEHLSKLIGQTTIIKE